MKLLPLWSGIMVPILSFGEKTSSSVAVKSSFQKLKNVTLHHLDLPINIESILEHHIISLREASLLKTGQKYKSISESTENVEDTEYINVEPINIICETNNMLNINKCPLCSMGTLPSINGTHKSKICGIPLHSLSSCSSHMEGDETIRVCFSCSEVKNTSVIENNAREKWNRKTQKQLKSKSYLLPNPHLCHININTSKNIKSLPILKNGSRANELKSLKLKNINGAIILNNT